jgi:alkanesulfonate monooxygenase SsuD/methylene tetrahydromethanopterin reductase-like flavin-dependent oxidoreductase (luciferase family)
MEFGVITSCALASPVELPGREAYEFVMSASRVAQQAGFDALGVANKHLAGPDHQFLSPLVMSANLLASFPGMMVSTNVFLLPYHNPAMVAEAVAALDMISPGNFLFGIGQGYRADEARTFQVRHAERGRRMAESIAIMKLLWQQGAATYAGEFWSIENADIGIKPLNYAGPPILIAADGARAISRIAERGGDFWYPSSRASTAFLREQMPAYIEGLGRAGKAYNGIPLIRDVSVGSTREEAESIMRDGITEYLRRQSGWGQPGESYLVDFDELKKDRLIFGSSQEVAEEFVALHREFGTNFLNLRVYLPGMDRERVLDVVRQLGEEVLPLVRREVGTGSMFGSHRGDHA